MTKHGQVNAVCDKCHTVFSMAMPLTKRFSEDRIATTIRLPMKCCGSHNFILTGYKTDLEIEIDRQLYILKQTIMDSING